jgi:transposase
VRRALVETRTQYVTMIRGLTRARGERLPRSETASFVEVVRRAPLRDDTRALVSPLLLTLEALEIQIALADAKLETLCAQEPVVIGAR